MRFFDEFALLARDLHDALNLYQVERQTSKAGVLDPVRLRRHVDQARAQILSLADQAAVRHDLVANFLSRSRSLGIHIPIVDDKDAGSEIRSLSTSVEQPSPGLSGFLHEFLKGDNMGVKSPVRSTRRESTVLQSPQMPTISSQTMLQSPQMLTMSSQAMLQSPQMPTMSTRTERRSSAAMLSPQMPTISSHSREIMSRLKSLDINTKISREPSKENVTPEKHQSRLKGVTDSEIGKVPGFLRSRIALEDVNRVLNRVHAGEKISAEYLETQLGFGSKAKALIMVLLQLNRIKSTCSHNGQVLYEIT